MPENNQKNITEIIQNNEAIPALQRSLDLLTKNFVIFIPIIAGMLFSQIIKFIAQEYFMRFEWSITLFLITGHFPGDDSIIGFILMVIRAGVSYFLTFVSIDMARNAFLKKEVDIMKSVNYVRQRIVPLTIVSIIAFIFSMTIIFIPIAILMFVIIIVDDDKIDTTLNKTIKTILNRPLDFVLLSVIMAVERIVLRWVLYPYIGHILTAPVDLLIFLAFIDLYIKSKNN